MKYILSGREMKQWEKQMMEAYKLPSLILMERAAQSVVKELTSGHYDLSRVLIVSGTGNNGGDGLAVARMLGMRGISVEVCIVGALERISNDAKKQLEMYEAISGKFVTIPAYHEYTVIVDAIFGIGCNREITGAAAEAIEGMNQASAPILSIDVPTGISSDDGKICGCAVKADRTITFFAEKLGMILYPGREYCGKIKVEGLEVPFDKVKERHAVAYGEEDLKKLPKRSGNSHKGTYGKVLVIAGSPKICGAAYLAAAGAYRIGAGLVKIYTPKENLAAMQILLPEALIEAYDRSSPSAEQLKQCLDWADVVVLGPGFGTDHMAEKILKQVMEDCRVGLVIDADGINILAKNKNWFSKENASIILTPHIQEMARLIKDTKDNVSKNPIGVAKDFVENYPVTLVLKDAVTIVAKENESLYVNTSGNSGMATGGSGDVLAGMLGGLLAQGMDALEAARLAVYLHGKAGDAAAAAKSAYSMTAKDILDGITEVTRV